MVEAGAVAEEHGREHAGIVGRQAKDSGQVAIGGAPGEAGEAAGGPCLRGEEAAGERGGIVCEEMEFLGAGGAVGGDSLPEEIVGVLPGAGVAEALRKAKAYGELDAVAAVEVWQRGPAGRGDDGGANAGGDGDKGGDVRSEVFDRGELKIDLFGLGGSVFGFGRLPGVLGVGCAGGDAGRKRADADSAANDSAGEIVGKRAERGLGVGCGAEMGGEDPGGDPEGGYGNGRDKVGGVTEWLATGVVEGEGGEQEKKGGGEQKQAGGMGVEGGEEITQSETDCGEQKRGAAQPEGLDGGGIVGPKGWARSELSGRRAGEACRTIAEADARRRFERGRGHEANSYGEHMQRGPGEISLGCYAWLPMRWRIATVSWWEVWGNMSTRWSSARM